MSSDLNTIEVLVPFRHCPTSNKTGACSQRHPTGGPTPSLQGLGGTHALCSRRNTRQWPSLKPGLPFPGLVPAPPSCSLFSDHHGGSWKPCGSLRSHWQSVPSPQTSFPQQILDHPVTRLKITNSEVLPALFILVLLEGSSTLSSLKHDMWASRLQVSGGEEDDNGS